MQHQPKEQMHDLSHEGQCKVCGRTIRSPGDAMTACPGPSTAERVEELITLFGDQYGRR